MALMSLAVKVVAEAVAEEAAGGVEDVVAAVSVQLHAMRSNRMVKLWMERRLRQMAAVACR